MDIRDIVSRTDKYNFHSHTQFCDGHAPMEDFVRSAVDFGITHYGFSPHSPIPFSSPCNMSMDSVKDYFEEVTRLRSQYEGAINLYAGMEIDYLGKEWGPSSDYFKNLPLDYSIASIHFIPTDSGEFIDIDGRFERFRGYIDKYFYKDIKHVVKEFFHRSISMIQDGGFTFIGHLDKIAHNASHYRPGIEDEAWYKTLAHELVDCVIASGIMVELNTKAYADHSNRLFPAKPLLKRLVEANVPVLVNSDAHRPSLIEASRREGLNLLTSIVPNE